MQPCFALSKAKEIWSRFELRKRGVKNMQLQSELQNLKYPVYSRISFLIHETIFIRWLIFTQKHRKQFTIWQADEIPASRYHNEKVI